MIRLMATGAAARLVLPPGRDATGWHAALVAEIAHHLSPAHAALLGRPQPGAAGTEWMANGTSRTRYADLPAEGRRALDAAVGAILSDIRRLAESGVAPAVAQAWPALRELPDMGHLFAVDGRPVLAAWGHVGGDDGAGARVRLARLDDGLGWRPMPVPPWRSYRLALGVLAALGLAAGLLLPLAYAWVVEKPPVCTIAPGQSEAAWGLLEAEGRGAQLRTLLASLTEELGRRQLLCPIAVTPVQAPPPRAALPQERWDRNDLGMLEGCWKLVTGLSVGPDVPANVVRVWELCFDGAGSGRQSVVTADGRSCTGALAATFGTDLLRITQPSPCNGTLNVSPSTLSCRRVSDTEATCEGRNLVSPPPTFPGTFLK